MRHLAIVVRPVERYPEPEFSRLYREVFAQVQQTSAELAQVLAAEADAGRVVRPGQPPHSPMVRLGAYVQGDEMVGWSCGWMERGQVFYMANSGVLPAYRRQGIYGQLLAAVRELADASGAVALRSQHSVLNNAVIIAKLRAGFHVTGLSQSAQMGTLVELTCHLSAPRLAMFRTRSLPYVVPDGEAPVAGDGATGDAAASPGPGI